MSILIADSGATSTMWAIIDGTKEQVVQTSGMNPALKVDAELESVVYDELMALISIGKINSVYFYGAGCGDWSIAERIKKLLSEAFSGRKISVKTDLEGAGVSQFGRKMGIIAISGTGSSCGFMDAGTLVDSMPSKAYPEGDFGSGAHIGALILKDFFADESPISIRELIESNRRLTIDELFVQFQDPQKSKMIASKVLKDLATSEDFERPMHQEYIKRVVIQSLELFFNQMKKHFGNALVQLPIRFIGSTAFTFEAHFREYFKQKGILIDEISQNPIRGLIKHHQQFS
jgi:hypothetical protein